MLHRGNNAINQPGVAGQVPSVLEMAALEDLGPKTRYAICNSPLATLAYPIVKQIIEANDERERENERRATLGIPQLKYLDPKHPDLDARLAQGVLGQQFGLLIEDRGIEEAKSGVTILRGKPSPRSVREQRRSQRRVRW